MFKKQIFGIMWILVAIVAVYVFVDQRIIKDYTARNPLIESMTNVPYISEIKREIIAPTPFRATTTEVILKNKINSSELIVLTNVERQKIGAPVLGNNALLDDAALAKAKDMLAKQYFDHVSPSEEDVSNFVQNQGYEYLIIGENLALGEFKDAKSIINAWMTSSGHRENILNSKYREIGATIITARILPPSAMFNQKSLVIQG